MPKQLEGHYWYVAVHYTTILSRTHTDPSTQDGFIGKKAMAYLDAQFQKVSRTILKITFGWFPKISREETGHRLK